MDRSTFPAELSIALLVFAFMLIAWRDVGGPWSGAAGHAGSPPATRQADDISTLSPGTLPAPRGIE
jgi:hypothetical protein